MNRLFLFSWLVLAGCSVSVGVVPNKPPQIDATVTTKMNTPEFGQMEFNDPLDMDGISMLFWPTELTKSEGELDPNCRYAQPYDELTANQKMSVKVCQVNTLSRSIDQEFEKLRSEVPKLVEPFMQANCLELSTVPAASINDPVEWPELDANDERASRVESCRNLKDQHTALIGEGVGKIGTYKASLVAEVGEENWVEINKAQSSLLIQPDGLVAITLRVGKVIYSTDLSKVSGKQAQLIRSAGYEPKYRLLKFEMNELNPKREQTGSVYKITLERMEILGMVRFTGDVQLVDASGTIKRSGSMQISGGLH